MKKFELNGFQHGYQTLSGNIYSKFYPTNIPKTKLFKNSIVALDKSPYYIAIKIKKKLPYKYGQRNMT